MTTAGRSCEVAMPLLSMLSAASHCGGSAVMLRVQRHLGCHARVLRDHRDVAQSIATEIAKDEYNHVAFLRTALGASAVAIPQVRICVACGCACSLTLASNVHTAASWLNAIWDIGSFVNVQCCFSKTQVAHQVPESLALLLLCVACHSLTHQHGRPQLNIGANSTGAFSVAANAALNMTLNPPFSPFENNLFFIHGAYIFEDVGVTAYQVLHESALFNLGGHAPQLKCRMFCQ